MKPTVTAAWQCHACDRWNAGGVRQCMCGHSRSPVPDMPYPPPPPPPRASEGPPARREAVPRVQTRTGAERELQRDCETWLRRQNIEYLHLSPRARERRGWPDLTFAVRGVPFAVELKAAGGQLTAEQAECLTRLAGNGWRTAVLRSVAALVALVDGKAPGEQAGGNKEGGGHGQLDR